MPEIRVRPLSARRQAEQKAKSLQVALRDSLLKGWRAPLHWTVPQAFDNPGRMYEELGHEEFLRQVTEYYGIIRDLRVERAQRAHTKWAIRQILRTFETHIRGFKGQHVGQSSQYGRRGAIFYRASGQEQLPSGRYRDIITMPDELAANGRLVADLEAYLRAYGVSGRELGAASRLVKAKLEGQWGVKL